MSKWLFYRRQSNEKYSCGADLVTRWVSFSLSFSQDIRNTVGNIPMEWYKDYPHIGYDLDGKKIFKPIRNKDELDEFLDKMENPDYWWAASGVSFALILSLLLLKVARK